jgi:predicted nucleotidyltransferase
MPQNDKALLTRLNEHGMEFVIIGGVCGVLHGVPLVTFDLDVCCPFTTENLRRLEAAVKDLHPCHRLTPDKLPLELSDELLARLKNLYLQTDLGKLDCLSEVTGIGDYQAVLQSAERHNTSHGEFHMLSLDALIIAKEAAGRERDLAAVRFLRAIKERKERS